MEATKTQIQARLQKVREIGFRMDFELLNSIPDLDINKIRIQFGFQVEQSTEENIFILNVQVVYAYPINKDEKVLVDLKTTNHYEIQDLQSLVKYSKGEFQDITGLLPTLLGISIGTLRGILLVKTTGTILADFPLPVVNATDLCKSVTNGK